MDHTFSQLILMILPVLSDGPRWRQVASHGVRNYYEKDQLQQEGTPFFLHTKKKLELSTILLNMKKTNNRS